MISHEIVHVDADDWTGFRVRLASLADSPDAFGSTSADRVEAPQEQWRARLVDVPLTLVARRDDRPVGVASGFPARLGAGPAVDLVSL